jgi:hypothetical protein
MGLDAAMKSFAIVDVLSKIRIDDVQNRRIKFDLEQRRPYFPKLKLKLKDTIVTPVNISTGSLII